MSRLDTAIAAAAGRIAAPPAPIDVREILYRGVRIVAHYRGKRPLGYGPVREFRSRRQAALAVLLARPKVRTLPGGIAVRRRGRWGRPVWACDGDWSASSYSEIARAAAIPYWLDRAATGGIAVPDALHNLVRRRRREIETLRKERAARKAVAPRQRRASGRYRGVPVTARLCPDGRVEWACGEAAAKTARKAVRLILAARRVTRDIDGVTLRRVVSLDGGPRIVGWMGPGNPTTLPFAEAARRARAIAPDPQAPRNLGWRVWYWSGQRLVSPQQRTAWPEDGILRAENWSDAAAVRGEAGIHARRLPRDWRLADPFYDPELATYGISRNSVVGVVEGWGRMLYGSEGWRAEYARILAVRAPSTEIGLEIERAYPSIEVYYDDREA
ncbi:MAG TPA: hypothetical protein VFA12_20410 [Stellaceae bacterium]|nr:hypothetical protein [Stellaceae bacterium]